MSKKKFQLDARLERDCFALGRFKLCRLLLMNNAAVPWFILVPETDVTEICDLNLLAQAILYDEINTVSHFVQELDGVEKLNVAAIGNVVSQLHIHVVGRHSSDFAWPGVVWGIEASETYTDEQVRHIGRQAADGLGEDYRPA
ncbi:MAG: HIT domain-containing protein [Gammaproteobacteria bacterium]